MKKLFPSTLVIAALVLFLFTSISMALAMAMTTGLPWR